MSVECKNDGAPAGDAKEHPATGRADVLSTVKASWLKRLLLARWRSVVAVGLLVVAFACSPSDTQVTSDQRTAPLDLSAFHNTGISPGSRLDPAQKAEIAGICADIGSDISIRLDNYFRLSQRFSLFICPLIAILTGALSAFVYWKVLARRRKVGCAWFLLCIGTAWLFGALIAVAAHKVWVQPALARAVAAHRAFFRLAQEGWIPKSGDETQRDFTANCSDRIADIITGGHDGHEGLKRYQTLYRSAELLPAEEANGTLYWAIIQNRARDLFDLYAVDSGFGKTQLQVLSWNGVTVRNARFEAAAASNGGWWIQSSLYPLGSIIIAVGIPLVAWLVLWLLSARVSATVSRNIKKYRDPSGR